MSGTYRILVLGAIGALLGGSARAGDAAGGYFEDERWGYKVRVPQGWSQVAMSADEEWIASKHVGKRELEPKKSEYYVRETPEMLGHRLPARPPGAHGEADRNVHRERAVRQEPVSRLQALHPREQELPDAVLGGERLLLLQGGGDRDRRRRGDAVRDQGREDGERPAAGRGLDLPLRRHRLRRPVQDPGGPLRRVRARLRALPAVLQADPAHEGPSRGRPRPARRSSTPRASRSCRRRSGRRRSRTS